MVLKVPKELTNEFLGFKEDEFGALSIDDIVIPPPPIATLSHDVPDKRLIITKLKIKNFKSYADEIILGPFDKNFTAIVGPNGSGKSNVIDSLLFVFGFRANKIRSKKTAHLIHKSARYPNVNSCSVKVYFSMIKEDGDTYKLIPGTEFTLSKTAFKDDSSYYEIDDKRVTQKVLAQTLGRYFIDINHNRFLVLQGEIEAISLMPAKGQTENDTGMLEYIEDIIGSNRYIVPTKKLKEKVEELNVKHKEKFNNLKLVEKEKEDLEEPKNKAIEFLRLQNRLTLNDNCIWHYKRFVAEKELKDISESKKEFEDKLIKLKAEINKVKNSKKSQETDLEKITSELETHVKDLEKYKEGYKSLERQDVAMHEEIKHLKTKKNKIESSLQSTKDDLAKYKKQSEVHKKETAELIEMKEKLETEKVQEETQHSKVISSLQNDTTLLNEKKDKLEAELLKMKTNVYQLKSEMELLQSKLDLCTKNDKKERQTLTSMISSYESAQNSSAEEEKMLNKEMEQISSMERELKAVMQKIAESQPKERDVSERLKNARLKYEEAKNSLSTFKNRNSMLQAFAKEKANGNLTGVYGRLGDLGAIDEKYDVAISTACGQLDNIVTDSLATAQKCVEFLKRNNLGYATFIPLDKMTMWIPYAHNKIATPENVPRLFDLVRVNDPDVLPAFYYALKDTLVANNLEQATRIGLQGSKRYRVVTLKGELIDLAGTMSGGGGRVFKGRMGQTVVECTHTPEDVAKISQEVEHASKAVTDIRNSIFHLQEQISKINKELPILRLSVKKRQSNYKAYLANAEMMKSQIENQKKKVENVSVNEEEVADLKENISIKQKDYQTASKEASVVEDKVSKLQEEILKITKGSISKIKKNSDQLAKKLSEVSQAMTKSVVNTKSCVRNISKAEDKIKILEKDFEVLTEKKTKLDAERENCVQKAREFFSKQEETQTVVNELKEKKIELKKVLEGFSDNEHQLKLEEINQKNELKEKEALESDKRSYIKGFTVKLAKLKLHEVENDSTEIPALMAEEIEKLSIKRISAESEILNVQLQEIKPDLASIHEYKKKEALCSEKQKDLDGVIQERHMQNLRYEELRKRRLTEFMRGFTEIAKKLKEIYQMLTLGGDAEMELVDTFEPFLSGIDFSVRPPRKSWKLMRNLSGGEKTLSSLALVFALHYYRPTPFYVMDEIDAALDVRNVAIVGYYLKERTKNTQFIIVSLRNIMNELADHLIGIYKTDNCSKNISLMRASRWKKEDQEEDQASNSNASL